MILHQVHFIGGLKSSDNRPAMRYRNTSSLEYIPATLKVVEYVSVHYGCPKCKTDEEKPNIIHAPVPPALLRSYASPSIVAWVIYSKYVNGMLLYRQEKDWLQYGFELSRATMANWVIECTDKYLRVLYKFYHRLLLSRGFAMADGYTGYNKVQDIKRCCCFSL